MKGDRCTGHCCKSFYLPHSPEELAENYRAWANREEIDRNGRKIIDGIWLIAPMVRHLGLRQAPPASAKPPPAGHHYEAGNYYACKHLEKNGDCGIYAMRPRMCRDYPYGKACSFKACTWQAARDGVA